MRVGTVFIAADACLLRGKHSMEGRVEFAVNNGRSDRIARDVSIHRKASSNDKDLGVCDTLC